MAQNPNITWDIIKNNPNKKWNRYSMSFIPLNNMKQGKKRWINNQRLRIIKALQIQRHWRNCSYNPEYKLTQKLIKNRII
jgi:hypothetical protein